MFTEFPKIPRFYRDIIVTEKIDGTNAQITIVDKTLTPDPAIAADPVAMHDEQFLLYAGSRNRYLSVGSGDDFGFAAWVQKNAAGLALLGPGTHYGEWWGSGIRRGYGLEKGTKRFSLFNVGRWTTDPNAAEELELLPPVPGLDLVPVLYVGPQINRANQDMVQEALKQLSVSGSHAARGFKNPEGVIIWHTHARQYVGKVTFGGDGHKGT